jgi:hypothetical protein
MVSKEARTKTVAQMIDRYIDHYLPFENHNKNTAKATALLLQFVARGDTVSQKSITLSPHRCPSSRRLAQ